jgi:thymidylate synthase (FAD)
MDGRPHLDKEINVLDHGYVKLVDYMGSDRRIVEAARVSTDSVSRSKHDDRRLIRYLMNQEHWSPFEQCEVVFEMQLPIFVARQMVRTRTASINECSGRYIELPDISYSPELSRMNIQAESNKQGSGSDVIENSESMLEEIEIACDSSFSSYHKLLESGLAKELARVVLPVSTYSKWYWKIDLRNLFNFLRLRLDSHSQYEIRVYAEAMQELVKPLFPIAYEAFEDYVLNACTFSAMEMSLLRAVINSDSEEFINFSSSKMTDREKKALLYKLGR